MSTTCGGNWGEWSECDAICDPNRNRISATGTQKRTYTVTNSNPPIKIETEAVCTKLCPVDCTGIYSNWGPCDGTCTNNQKNAPGFRKRTFSITRSSNNGGLECSDKEIAEECVKLCPINCVGKWSEWSGCETTGTCDGKEPFINGKKKRKYIITTPASNGGNSCLVEDGKIETEDCRKECKVDSMFFWIAVSSVGILGLLFLIGIIYYIRRKSATVTPVSTSSQRGRRGSGSQGHSQAPVITSSTG
jgi:hypothetical protein